MNTQTETEQSPFIPIIVIIGSIGTFYFLFGVLPERYASKPDPNKECTMVTKERQTIVKIDGSLDSNKKESIYGCEYKDDSFLEMPD